SVVLLAPLGVFRGLLPLLVRLAGADAVHVAAEALAGAALLQAEVSRGDFLLLPQDPIEQVSAGESRGALAPESLWRLPEGLPVLEGFPPPHLTFCAGQVVLPEIKETVDEFARQEVVAPFPGDVVAIPVGQGFELVRPGSHILPETK